MSESDTEPMPDALVWNGLPPAIGEGRTEYSIERLLTLEAELGKHGIGPMEPVTRLSKAIRKSCAGLKDPRRPIAFFLAVAHPNFDFSTLAIGLSEILFGSPSILTLHMSNYREKHQVSSLVGPPPGIIGYGPPGELTEPVRVGPRRVVILRDIELAHAEVIRLICDLLEEGHLIDNFGRVVAFRECVFFATMTRSSNELQPETESPKHRIPTKIRFELESHFPTGFLTRTDDIVLFPAPEPDNV